ncbi:T9SS type A sorting domain-containing protein [Algibacter sp. 2305UL17-15]|uniref:T9SS type A sorting domain-containing protein n=1 Tax=Algibacter sp. 2305UL17-15 TaxID=3231268 RepID=UPI003457F8F4
MKKIICLKLPAFLIAIFSAVSFGYGQSIFTNSVTGTDPGLTSPYTTGQIVNANITATGISRGSGITGRAANNRYNAINWNSPSIDNTDYFEFTLSPNALYEIDFVSFVYTGQASGTGPTNFVFRSSLDGYTANIGTPTAGGTTINLSSSTYQNITSAITFRFYGWGASSPIGTYSINDFIFNGNVGLIGTCSLPTVTWTAGAWLPISGPTINTPVVIADNYNTSINGNFRACTLTVDTGYTLTVNNNSYVEVENDAIIDGTIIVESQGNFVQNDSNGSFTLNGSGVARVNKQTATKAEWYYYTYWSSPVVGATVWDVFPNVDYGRRFWFNAANFVDTNGNDIDDNGDDWQIANGTMDPGVGYAVTEAQLFVSPGTGTASFEGEFNTGDIPVNITLNVANTGVNWNFIGNPYPSAIDFIAFQQANSSIIDGAAYFWSQARPLDALNPGNQGLNFNLNDYATFTIGTGGTAGGTTIVPTGYVGSGQGFFIPALNSGTATFTNAIRMADATSNSQFFKGSITKKSSLSNEENKLWINLTSGNGVFNQILVGYVDGATDLNDGLSYDAPKLLTQDFAAALYTAMDTDLKKYVIQGKHVNSIDKNEVIKLGFSTNIEVATIYKLSVAQFEGEFLNTNSVFLLDKLLHKIHNLTDSDYSFTSETGEFNDRFEIVFNEHALLSTDDFASNPDNLTIVELENNNVKFSTTHSTLKSIAIFDLLGRELYNLKGHFNSETFRLANLKSSIYIAKVQLSNGSSISKKFFKK